MRSSTMRVLTSAILLLSIAGRARSPCRGRPLCRVCVSTAWSPFTNGPGQPRFALDLVEAALDRVGVDRHHEIVDAAQFTTALLSGKFDGSAAAWKDAERETTLLFSQPYLENRLMLVARRGGDVSGVVVRGSHGQADCNRRGISRTARPSIGLEPAPSVRAIEVSRKTASSSSSTAKSTTRSWTSSSSNTSSATTPRQAAHAARDRFDPADPATVVPCRQPNRT